MAANAAPKSSLFDDLEPAGVSAATAGYSAKDIEVLEGLEPVRKRPGMYIGGTDARAMHHLFAEVLDNSMDPRSRWSPRRLGQWTRHPNRPAPKICRQVRA